MFKSGFIAIVGRPNSGKSTLINRLVEEKVSIVSWRPQTTRNRIVGIVNGEGYQAVFIDTPGIHKAKNKLSEYMMKGVSASLTDVDAVIYMIDGTNNLDDTDKEFLESYNSKAPLFIALNKIDEANMKYYAVTLDKLNVYKNARAVYPISAKTGKNVDELKAELINILPIGEKMYPDDMYTDRTLRFMAGEIIREKALMFLNEEIPYGIGVKINKFKRRAVGKEITDVEADLICEREQHKAIVIGKNAAMLKKIGESARKDIERLAESQIFLKLYVKTEKDWRDNPFKMEDIGYDKENL